MNARALLDHVQKRPVTRETATDILRRGHAGSHPDPRMHATHGPTDLLAAAHAPFQAHTQLSRFQSSYSRQARSSTSRLPTLSSASPKGSPAQKQGAGHQSKLTAQQLERGGAGQARPGTWEL